MSILKRIGIVCVVITSCVGCDQTAKLAAEQYLAPFEVHSFLNDTVRLELAHNYGAFLSLGDSLPQTLRFWVVLVGSLSVVIGLIIYLGLQITRNMPTILGISLLVGGGLANIVDRVGNGGYVVDFISLGIGPIRTGIFNVADVALCLGLVLVYIGQRAHYKRTEQTRA